MRRTDKHSAGFSLVEVILALGLLAAVLISIAGLFVIGNRSVASGRNTTEALAVGRAMLEEMNGWGFRQTYQLYGMDDTQNAVTVDTLTNAYAQKWQPTLDDTLPGAPSADITVSGFNEAGVIDLATARALRVDITISWAEQNRNRSVTLSTMRM